MTEKTKCGDIKADGVMNAYEAADNSNADGRALSGTIHLPGAAGGRGPGLGRNSGGVGWGGRLYLTAQPAPPTGARVYCTPMRFWLCPCCCSARCL